MANDQTIALRQDVQRVNARLQQLRCDEPDHAVAIAMTAADLKRAEYRLATHLLNSDRPRYA